MIVERNDKVVKVWSAGCACGEEVYSFKILWDVLQRRSKRLPELELWATDMNPEVLERARAGIYPFSSLKELPAEVQSNHFLPVNGNCFAISDSLKEGIQWKLHNLFSEEPPRRGFQIIFLRNNLLTYYKDELQKSALRKILKSLTPGGFLFIGAHEKIPAEFSDISPFDDHRDIFRKAVIAGEES
jgi:chemotaxis protein methyltransferase CheR